MGSKSKNIIFKNKRTMILVRIALFVALITVGAFIRIPLPFEDYFTLQLFFVIFCGVMLGPIYGTASVLIYILLGLFGVPVFAGGGGFSYVLKPTFGYLIGFIFSAVFSGLIVTKRKKLPFYILACFTGLIITYAIGIPFKFFALNYWFGQEKAAFGTVIISSVPVYLPSDILMSLLAAFLGFKLRRFSIFEFTPTKQKVSVKESDVQ